MLHSVCILFYIWKRKNIENPNGSATLVLCSMIFIQRGHLVTNAVFLLTVMLVDKLC